MKLESLQRDWDELGRKDPLWAVLTWPGRRGNRWDASEFFATGVSEIADLVRYIEGLGWSLPRRRALDFGCGVGRLTQPLADHFDEVWGLDIAPSMIALAERYNTHGDRCKYRLNSADDLSCFPDASFDLIYSKLTLQHTPPDSARRFIAEFVRVLHPKGLVIFQMAGEPLLRRTPAVQRFRRFARRFVPAGAIRCYRKLRYGHLIDMHGLPRGEVVALLEESGAKVLDTVQDTSAGGGWTSYRYCACSERRPSVGPGV